jgi:hypothetical protein
MPGWRLKLSAEIIKLERVKKSGTAKLTGQPPSIWQIIGLLTGFA